MVQDPDGNDTEMGMRKAQHGNAPAGNSPLRRLLPAGDRRRYAAILGSSKS
jgi:hypothetical protein